MIKINKLEIENVKRIRAVNIVPSENGLTVIGGKNNQGKTSVLDSIAWALGGDKYRPSQAPRDGSTIPPHLRIVLSNGLEVERKGKNSDLKVTDPTGQKAGQQLLNEFVEQLAIDLPKFIESPNREKANTLLQIIGISDQLFKLESSEKELYQQRLTVGQIADQKEKFAKEMTYYSDAPKQLISAGDLILQQQKTLAINGENQRKRENLERIKAQAKQIQDEITALLQKQKGILADLEIAEKSAENLQDESTLELEQNIANIEKINIKVRSNLDKEKAEEDAKEFREQYESLTAKINSVRKEKIDLLTNAELPLEGLSVEDGELIYLGKRWDNMSGSDQLKVSTAIVRKLNPKCGFVLLDKLEQMDIDTMNEFGTWLESEGLQAIATRVSTGEECSLIIEDGYVSDEESPKTKGWTEGEF